MHQLLEIGFQHAGRWTLKDDALALELARMGGQRNVLYAFVTEQLVLYVGKTTGTFEGRMSGYLRPHATQRTNVRNHTALTELLRSGKPVDIYAWADTGLHRVGQFHLNYAAGLEDGIIQKLSPPWNGARSAPQGLGGPVLRAREGSESAAPVAAPVVPAPAASDDTAATAAEVQALEASGKLSVPPTFQVKLGKTYFHHGFFNVPVRFSGFFPEHGAEIAIYCGDGRALVRAIVDRNANQGSGTPRIYGKAALASWFRQNRLLDDEVTIQVVNRNEIELR